VDNILLLQVLRSRNGFSMEIRYTLAVPDYPSCVSGWSMDATFWDQVERGAMKWGFTENIYQGCLKNCSNGNIPPCGTTMPPLMVLFSKAACHYWHFNPVSGEGGLYPCSEQWCTTEWAVCCNGQSIQLTKLGLDPVSLYCPPFVPINPFIDGPCGATCE
jgi:hypothetical protein